MCHLVQTKLEKKNKKHLNNNSFNDSYNDNE